MINAELKKLVGGCCNASDGKITRDVALSGPGSLGMGAFNPRAGSTKREKYVVDGVSAGGGSGGSRSQRRSAGESADAGA